jgi:hypothetical protein
MEKFLNNKHFLFLLIAAILFVILDNLFLKSIRAELSVHINIKDNYMLYELAGSLLISLGIIIVFPLSAIAYSLISGTLLNFVQGGLLFILLLVVDVISMFVVCVIDPSSFLNIFGFIFAAIVMDVSYGSISFLAFILLPLFIMGLFKLKNS